MRDKTMPGKGGSDWKVGDWCFYEFALVQIKEVQAEYGVCDVSTGIIRSGGRNSEERIRPLTLHNAALTQVFDMMSSRLHREGSAGLNYPRFKDHLVDLWLRACDGDDKATDEAGEFVNKVLLADREREIDGIALTRPRL